MTEIAVAVHKAKMAMNQIFLLLILSRYSPVCCMEARIAALLGSCVEIPCTHWFDENTEMSDVVWYAGDSNKKEILNTENSSSVIDQYRNRTSAVLEKNNCKLWIDPVRIEDSNVYQSEPARKRRLDDSHYVDYVYDVPYSQIVLAVKDSPDDLQLSVDEYLIEEKSTTIQCSTDHTCDSSPPSLQWNKPGQIQRMLGASGLYWIEASILIYIPSYVDDGTPLRCTATYHNGMIIEKSAELKIHFAPKFVTVNIMENGMIIEGSDVTLACTSVSRPGVSTYEWYKGRNRTKLPYTGWKMTVRNVTKDEDLYSCAAINDVGIGESALKEIPVLYVGSSHSFMASNGNIIFLAIFGTVCPLLLVLLVYFIWRKRCRKVTSSEAVESTDAAYCDLVKKDVESEYEDLKPRNSTHITLPGRQLGAANLYASTHK
ncbi:sialoadhesin-like isoform X1 [Phyllobates terribilis]|uniref:sialoadhesin-like isoform X1 n=1 Tax=Phyllobates terribilis TaxID=111132 RepID=UPI003CCAEE95